MGKGGPKLTFHTRKVREGGPKLIFHYWEMEEGYDRLTASVKLLSLFMKWIKHIWRLRWFGHLQRRPTNAPTRKLDSIETVEIRRVLGYKKPGEPTISSIFIFRWCKRLIWAVDLYTPEEITIEEEAERKIGWLFKLLFIGTASVVAYQFVPYMGENVMQQSVALLRVKDPLFKRMGASRLSRFAADDERRMKILEMGGGDELLKMLGTAKDDHTRIEAFKALLALAESDEAVENLHKAGAKSVIMSISKSSEDSEVMNYKYKLLRRFQDLKYDVTS
ncbi:hypothetical protein Syun_003005 [Stephania yunnanensis]|uniref:ARM repeat superfamily protein n=1 Tax=Stephania yunnanensis TaxID=152371 RepID=A0AAP0L0E2_9MAGN